MKSVKLFLDSIEIDGRTFPAEYNIATDTAAALIFVETGRKPDGRPEKQKIVIPEGNAFYPDACRIARQRAEEAAADKAAEEEAAARKAARAARKAEREAKKAAAAADPEAPKKAQKEWAGEVIQGKGWQIVFDAEMEKTRVIFEKFPTKEARETVKAAGFWWNSYTGSWNKKLTNKARRAALQLAKDLGTLKKITA